MALTDEEFLEQAWRLVLQREPDEAGRDEGLERLRSGRISRASYLAELVADAPFARVRALDDAFAYARLHARSRPRDLRAPGFADERAIEIPWVLTRYDGERRVLDVGTVFAERAYVAGLRELGAELTTVDLADGADVVADVRDLPFEDGAFDLAFCVSTLEHVGRDNSTYAVDAPREEAGDEAALRELRRVASRVLVTVPTGVRDDQGWQLQREPLEWIELFERAGFSVYEDELYVRTGDGWQSGSLHEAAQATYGEHGAGAVLLAELRPATVGEKLRLAVRDVRHRDVVRRSTLVP
ncbi:MAG: methyltransferase domain-containing protein [Actinomycetota bacterium]